LTQSLIADGHSVRRLVRRAPVTDTQIEWHPERGDLDPAVLADVDAVICLSGARIGPKLVFPSYRKTVLDSRVDTTATLADALAAAQPKPAAFIVASAVGYYGDTGDRVVDESQPAGAGVLADICARWEAAARPAADAGVRVAHLRTGLLLARGGGLLAALKPLVWLGVAGPIGSGRQFMPWIAMADEIAAILFVLDHDDVVGPVNLTGPAPVRNVELIKTMARMMHRPAVLPVPAFAIRLALRDAAPDLLGGQRAIPAKLTASGFRFAHPTLRSALDAVL
jgi:uncharacterized protein (TIGR01777 family)